MGTPTHQLHLTCAAVAEIGKLSAPQRHLSNAALSLRSHNCLHNVHYLPIHLKSIGLPIIGVTKVDYVPKPT